MDKDEYDWNKFIDDYFSGLLRKVAEEEDEVDYRDLESYPEEVVQNESEAFEIIEEMKDELYDVLEEDKEVEKQ